MNWRTPVAKAVYRVAGYASWIRTPQPRYEFKLKPPDGPDQHPAYRAVFAGYSRQPIKWSWDLLELSERIDPVHWDHWATGRHEGHVAVRCATCAGHVHCFECDDHDPELDWDEDEVTGDTW